MLKDKIAVIELPIINSGESITVFDGMNLELDSSKLNEDALQQAYKYDPSDYSYKYRVIGTGSNYNHVCEYYQLVEVSFHTHDGIDIEKVDDAYQFIGSTGYDVNKSTLGCWKVLATWFSDEQVPQIVSDLDLPVPGGVIMDYTNLTTTNHDHYFLFVICKRVTTLPNDLGLDRIVQPMEYIVKRKNNDNTWVEEYVSDDNIQFQYDNAVAVTYGEMMARCADIINLYAIEPNREPFENPITVAFHYLPYRIENFGAFFAVNGNGQAYITTIQHRNSYTSPQPDSILPEFYIISPPLLDKVFASSSHFLNINTLINE